MLQQRQDNVGEGQSQQLCFPCTNTFDAKVVRVRARFIRRSLPAAPAKQANGHFNVAWRGLGVSRRNNKRW
jgi:hypothetical protein